MAFPAIPTGGRVLTTYQANTTATRTFPNLSSLTKNSGDLLIAIIACYDCTGNNATFGSWGGSFIEFVDQGSTTGPTMAIGAAYKWSTGSESGTFTVTQAGTPAGHAAMILLSIAGAHATTPPEGGSWATGLPPDPASFNPANWDVEDTLWIAVGGNGETSASGTWTGMGSAPSNYGSYVDCAVPDNSVVGQADLAVAFRQLTAASEDVSTFTEDTSNARGAAIVIAIRPAPLVYTDAATAAMLLSPSAAEIHEIPDATTTIYLLVPSGAELKAHDYVDSSTVTFTSTPFTTQEGREITDSNTSTVLSTPSGTDVYTPGAGGTEYDDQATISFVLVPSTVDVADLVDSATSMFVLTPASGDVATDVDAKTSTVMITPSSAEIHEIPDTATTSVLLSPSTVDIAQFADSAITLVDMDCPGSEFREITDANTAPVAIKPSSSDIAQYVEAATSPLLLFPSSVDVAASTESQSAYLDILSSGTDEQSGQKVDADTAYLDVQASPGDILETSEQISVLLNLRPSTIEYAPFVDVQLVGLQIGIVGVEHREIVDGIQVYLDLQAGMLFVKVDFLLEILGMQTRWTFEMPLTQWLIEAARRWSLGDSIVRWAILTTRRFTWRS